MRPLKDPILPNLPALPFHHFDNGNMAGQEPQRFGTGQIDPEGKYGYINSIEDF